MCKVQATSGNCDGSAAANSTGTPGGAVALLRGIAHTRTTVERGSAIQKHILLNTTQVCHICPSSEILWALGPVHGPWPWSTGPGPRALVQWSRALVDPQPPGTSRARASQGLEGETNKINENH